MPYKILLIDDDSDDREFYHDALLSVSDNVELTVLENGLSLIHDLDTGKVQIPDLIFLDINIPGMTGWSCLSQLKQSNNYAAIPVIMYSTSSPQEEAEKAKNASAFSFFSKPYEFSELKAALQEVMEYMERNSLSELAVYSKRFF